MRGRLWPGLCVRWRLSTVLFRWMPDRFPFSVRTVFLSGVRRFASVFGLPCPVFSSGSLFLLSSVNRWVLRPFPVFPVSTLIYMRCFHVWLLVHLPCFPCVRLLSSSIHLSLPRASSFFYSLCPSLFIFPLYTAPDTCPIFSLCAFHPGTSSSLSSFLPYPSSPWWAVTPPTS